MRMVDSMETSYSMHGHTRSLSSIASTILPIASDASTYTSLTASPMEPHDLEPLPIELKIPLPSSSCCSEQDFPAKKTESDMPQMNDGKNAGQTQQGSKSRDFDLHIRDSLKENVESDHDHPRVPESLTLSLEDLAQLAELENQQRARAISASSHLDRLSMAYGLKRRLCSTLKIAYGNLIDQYKSDDQAGFAGLHEALEKLKESCTGQIQGLTRDNSALDTENSERNLDLETSQTWIQELSGDQRTTALDFLQSLRNDPDVLATRIGLLSPMELGALTSSYHPAGVEFSVLANHSHGMTHIYSRDSQMMKLSRRMDNIQHFHDQDPFFTLMYCLFDTSAKPGSLEYAQRNAVWSSVCAKVIVDQKPGNEELIIAAADAFMSFEDWELKPRMETYLQTVLAEGAFLVDPLANPLPDSTNSLESKTADYGLRVDGFFQKALSDLFDLINSATHGAALPRKPRDFIRSTLGKIEDPHLRVTAKDFFVSRWYFASFLSSILVYPELAGLFMTQHIGENARQNVLKQIVIRMQLQVFDVLRSQADDMLVMLERRVQILAISNNFEPSEPEITPGRVTDYLGDQFAHNTHQSQIMLSHQELSGLIRTLYPNNPLSGDPSQTSPIPFTSAAPSTTSSSTLQPDSNDVGSSASSSIGPNYSGSSINSDVTITGNGHMPIHAPMENVSNGLYSNVAATTSHRSQGTLDFDATHFASRLWLLHAKLYAIAKKAVDNSVDSLGPSRWAVFQVRSNRVIVTMNETSPSSRSLARNDSLHLTSGPDSDYLNLKKSITNLLTISGQRQLPKLDRSRPLTMAQESLCALFEDALASSRLTMDFLHVHDWQRCLEIYSRITSKPDGSNFVKELLGDIGMQFQVNTRNFSKLAETRESLARSLTSLDTQQRDTVLQLENEQNALRIKMWYNYDVKHSSTFEEALLVTKALRAMSSPKRNRPSGGTFNWARQRLRGPQSQERAEAQTLEAMTAPKDCGGRRKLSDDQVEMTSKWLTNRGIENLCIGEERIHRYCYQVQKSVDRLAGASLLESPVLWSSHLFKREKAALDALNLKGLHSPLRPFRYGSNRISLAPGQYGLPPISTPVNIGATTVGQSTFGPLGSSSAFPTSLAGLPYSSSSHSTRAAHPLSSKPSSRTGQLDKPERSSLRAANAASEAFIQDVKKALYGLLTTDLGHLLWTSGSETDAWISKAALEEHLAEKATTDTTRSSLEVQTGESQHLQTESSSTQTPSGTQASGDGQYQEGNDVNQSNFDFFEAYQILLHRMSTTHNPFIKLEMVLQLKKLVIRSLEDSSNVQSVAEWPTRNAMAIIQSEPMARSKSVPRTQATNIEEVIANCTERRAEALRATTRTDPEVSTDAIVNELLTIFRSPDLRPPNLFLSLQYIAAFVPLHILDHTAHGEAFWNCSLAALALKEDLTNSTVRRAGEITNAHISTARLASPPYPSQQEAANLWLIAAKEGSPVAARELGLFYLTHPHLLPQRVTKPLSLAKDVFKSARAGDNAGGDDNKERGGLNPFTFDVVYHWMVIASNGGDAEAKAFLRQSGHA